MDEEADFRRTKLQSLVSSFGYGGIAKLAKEVGVGATYVSRLLSDPSSKQHRAITGEMVLKISSLYPDWLSDNGDTRKAIRDKNSSISPRARTLISRIEEAESSGSSSPQLYDALEKVMDLIAPLVTRNGHPGLKDAFKD